MTIKSFVGGHDVNVYTDCIFDENTRKFTGGRLLTVIPYSGRMLNAKTQNPTTDTIDFNGTGIPVNSPQVFEAIDPIPPESECDFCIVSAMYVAACKSLGIDTSRLLTIGGPVTGEGGYVIGTTCFNRN